MIVYMNNNNNISQRMLRLSQFAVQLLQYRPTLSLVNHLLMLPRNLLGE